MRAILVKSDETLNNSVEIYYPATFWDIGWRIYRQFNIDPASTRIFRKISNGELREIIGDFDFNEVMKLPGELVLEFYTARPHRSSYNYISDYYRKHHPAMNEPLRELFKTYLSGNDTIEKFRLISFEQDQTIHLVHLLNCIKDFEELDLSVILQGNYWFYSKKHPFGTRCTELYKRLSVIERSNLNTVDVFTIIKNQLEEFPCSSLRYLNIANYNISSEVLGSLFESMQKFFVLQALNISKIAISQINFRILGKSLNKIIPFSVLECESCRISIEHFDLHCLNSEQSFLKRIRCLNLRDNNLAKCSLSLDNVLSNCRKLKTLDISKCQLSTQELINLFNLPNLDTLTSIFIDDNQIENLTEIIDSIFQNRKQVELIDFGWTFADFRFINYYIESLPDTLHTIDLSSVFTQIRELTCLIYRQELLNNLKVLHLGQVIDNLLSQTDRKCFDFLDFCWGLTDFSMTCSTFSKELIMKLSQLYNLKRVSLWNLKIKDNNSIYVINMIKTLPFLSYLFFGNISTSYNTIVGILGACLTKSKLNLLQIKIDKFDQIQREAIYKLEIYNENIKIHPNFIQFQKIKKIKNLVLDTSTKVCINCKKSCQSKELCKWSRARNFISLKCAVTHLKII